MSAAVQLRELCPPPDGRQSARALAICTGTRRLLAGHGLSTVTELTLASGRRADIVGLSRDGCIWIVEVKSSHADFGCDAKWPDYREFCDRLFFAVGSDFDTSRIPEDVGLIVADPYGAAMIRDAPEHRLTAARRKAVTLRFAHAAANRFHSLLDPAGAAGWSD